MNASVAIAGSGMVGSYLHRLLQRSGIAADIYGDGTNSAQCGIRPCGWGTSNEFLDLVRASGLEPNEYVLKIVRTVNFEGADINAKLITFDKPRLLRDLLEGREVLAGRIPSGKYERIIDATGVARAYLPPVSDQILIPCIQYRVRNPVRDGTRFAIRYGNIGYSWVFPLREGEFHIGAGSLLEDPAGMLREAGFPDAQDSVLCGCSGTVRTSSPDRCLPFVVHDKVLRSSVWGVGESVGIVGPITGEGIVPGMQSARILLENWDDPQRYSSRLLKAFSWMAGERAVINKVWRKERLSIPDWIVLRGSGRRMGSEVSLGEVRTLLRCLNKYADRNGAHEGQEAGRESREPIASDQGG